MGGTFKVNIDKKCSDPWNFTCRIPHESILRPLLFFLYVNDMPQSVNSEFFLYPDDTCLPSQHENVKEIENQLNLKFSGFFGTKLNSIFTFVNNVNPDSFKKFIFLLNHVK